jgi:hypothetical protein
MFRIRIMASAYSNVRTNGNKWNIVLLVYFFINKQTFMLLMLLEYLENYKLSTDVYIFASYYYM